MEVTTVVTQRNVYGGLNSRHTAHTNAPEEKWGQETLYLALDQGGAARDGILKILAPIVAQWRQSCAALKFY